MEEPPAAQPAYAADALWVPLNHEPVAVGKNMQIVFGILIVIVVIVAAALLTVAAVSGIRRSRQKHGSSGALSVGILEIQSLLEPSKRHVVNAARDEAESPDEETSGEPPE